MKLIDLLNMIARGEETPDKIMYKGHLYTHNGMSGNGNYYCDELSDIIENQIDLNDLTIDEVEIVGEKKIPEKLEEYISCGWYGTCKDLPKEELFKSFKKIGEKINEIIDYLREKEDE